MATLTVYPDPDEEVSTVDGRVQRYNAGETSDWNDIRTGAGTNFNDDGDPMFVAGLGRAIDANRWRYMMRSIYLFDTSALGGGAIISAATFSLYGIAKIDELSEAPGIALVSSNPASDIALENADYGTLGIIRFATDITYAAFTNDTYNVFTLNATGLAAISKIGITKFGVRFDADLDNSEPAGGSGTDETYIQASSADHADITQDPKLVITYTVVTTIEPPAMDLDVEMAVPTVTPSLAVEPTLMGLDMEMATPSILTSVLVEPPAFNLGMEFPVPTLSLLVTTEPPAFLVNIVMGILDIAIYQPLFTNRSIKPTTSFAKESKPLEGFTKQIKPLEGWAKQPKP